MKVSIVRTRPLETPAPDKMSSPDPIAHAPRTALLLNEEAIRSHSGAPDPKAENHPARDQAFCQDPPLDTKLWKKNKEKSVLGSRSLGFTRTSVFFY